MFDKVSLKDINPEIKQVIVSSAKSMKKLYFTFNLITSEAKYHCINDKMGEHKLFYNFPDALDYYNKN